MCQHQPSCPAADAVDRDAAHVVVSHPEQGWSLLCNGTVLFEDTGALLPDGQSIPPHQPAVATAPVRLLRLSWLSWPAAVRATAGASRSGA
jgi:hypothetical protein